MKNLVRLIICLLLASNIFDSNAGAKDREFNIKIKDLVQNFWDIEILHDRNIPRNPSCMSVACDLLGELKCNDLSDIKAIGQACRGNYNGLCLREVCSHLEPFGCSDISDLRTIAPACSGNVDGSCVQDVCSRLSPLGCQNQSDLVTIAKACAIE